MLLERHATPMVNVALAVDAGYAADEPAKAGLAALALDLLDDGTTTRDAFRDRRRARRARRPHHDGSSLDLSFVRLQALPANLAPSLQLMADVVLNPVFPADMVALEKRRRIAQIGQEKADPRTRGAAGRAAAALRRVARLRQAVHRDRRGIDGRVDHARRSAALAPDVVHAEQRAR